VPESLTGPGALFLGSLILAGTAIASGLVTLIFLWWGTGGWRTRLAWVAGFLVSIPFFIYVWRYHEPPTHRFYSSHYFFALIALVGAIIGPSWIARIAGDPRWMPPGSRDRARAMHRTQEPWRDQPQPADPGRDDRKQGQGREQAGASDHRQRKWFRAATGPMTSAEAWEVLGLEPGTSAEEIRKAHHRLMLKLHPDVGGSNDLASKVNAARDILLRSSP
jgi:hypothetical protein